jgi:beta-lactam-binding protein with PASTA domain
MRGAPVSVPSLIGLSVRDARRVAQRSSLVASGPDPDNLLVHMVGTVVRQSPPPGAEVERWSVVTVWTTGDGDAGVREPRDPHPPLREIILDIDPETGTTEETVLE